MKLSKTCALALFSSVTMGTLMAGCSSVTPVKNARQGFLDRLSSESDSYLASDDPDSYGSAEAPHDSSRPAAIPVLDKQDRRPVSESRMRTLKSASRGWGSPLQQYQVTSGFGARGKDYHEGIDLRAKRGTPVYSVQEGKVIYAGKRISGYGNMVIIRHPSGLSTVYAHNSKLLVKPGERVKRAHLIAMSGNTGSSRGPHLHFEVRDGIKPIDPVALLGTRAKFVAAEPDPRSQPPRKVASSKRSNRR